MSAFNKAYKDAINLMKKHKLELQAALLVLLAASAAFTTTTEDTEMNDKIKVLLEEALDFLNDHIAKIDAMVNEIPAGPEGKLIEEAATALASEVVPALDAEVHHAS